MPIFAFEKSVGAIVFSLKGNTPYFLLLQYPGGHWGFIKGHTEKGETEMQTLLREAQEETGLIDLDVFPNFLASEMYYYRAKREEEKKRKANKCGTRIFKRVVYYLAKTKQHRNRIRLSYEHRSFLWLAYNEAFERITNANSKKVLEKANSFLGQYLSNIKK